MLSSIPDEFIPESISSRVVVIENDSFVRKGYKVNLVENNNKNNLYHVIRSVSINKSEILNGCIYTNVNESRQNPYWKLIFAIYNLSNDNIVEDHNDKPRLVISYNLHGNEKLLNN